MYINLVPTFFPLETSRRQAWEQGSGVVHIEKEDPSNRKTAEGDTIFCWVYMQTFWSTWLPSRDGIKDAR